jgi:hypothetical protein
MSRKDRKKKSNQPGRLSQWWNSCDGDSRRAAVRGVLAALLTAALIGSACWGLVVLEQRVTVVLQDVPPWMPGALARQIGEELILDTPYLDESLTRRVFERAGANPWVAEVRAVTKSRKNHEFGVVTVKASYRRPVAVVQTETGRFLPVDAVGVRLPAAQLPRYFMRNADGTPGECFVDYGDMPHRNRLERLHYVVIQGVSQPPPPPGQVWPGDDIQAGLKLVELVSTRSYCNQITVVDVRNHGGRISRYEPNLLMYAQVDRGSATRIKFGRFPRPDGDYVVLPERKMKYLDDYVNLFNGQLAGIHREIDLRRDALSHSSN